MDKKDQVVCQAFPAAQTFYLFDDDPVIESLCHINYLSHLDHTDAKYLS